MCRVLGYLGSPVLIDELLFAADLSLVGQATDGPGASGAVQRPRHGPEQTT